MDPSNALERAKDQLIQRAARAADEDPMIQLSSAGLLPFLRRYYRHVASEDLVAWSPEDVLAAAWSHRVLAATRPQATATIRVSTPEGAGHSVIEVVFDDMPFLVDSVTAELSRHGRAIQFVVHPLLVVRRDIAGGLLAVCDASSAGELGPDCADGITESWMRVEIDRENDPGAQEVLAADLDRVLRDVREAVEDWPRTRATAMRIAEEIAVSPPTGIGEQEVAETVELLRWLADDHFTFLGYREYILEADEAGDRLLAVPASGLGILRADQPQDAATGRIAPEVGVLAREPRLVVITKANSRSTVHRRAYLDYVGVKTFDDAGQVTGERRFLGLFTSAAYSESIQRIPVLRRKASEVLTRSGFTSFSHSGKDLLQILETYPRDELFQISVDDLEKIGTSVLHLQERRQLRLFLRRDDYGRYMSCMVYLPRDRYTTQVRLAMESILLSAFEGSSVDYTALVSESVLARLHFVVRVEPRSGLPEVDPAQVEARLVAATRSWDDDLVDGLVASCGEIRANELLATYGDGFPEAYKEDLPARAAVDDVERIESLASDDDIDLHLYTTADGVGGGSQWRLKLLHVGEPVSLSMVLPRLRDMGVEVVDERPYDITRMGRPRAWVYDFGLRYDHGGELPDEAAGALFKEAFAALWDNQVESDGFNQLVLRAGLSWRRTMVLRAYAKYLRQGGSPFSQDYIQECLVSNAHLARLLVQLFEARLDPDRGPQGSPEAVDALLEEIRGALDEVASLDQDRILRSFLSVITATLRTNFFQVDADGRPKSYVSIKLDPQQLPDLPQPRPRFEIWVYSPRVEGVHLRFGPVARGGLRWSDRREDFRTEVLGLVKAQMVKNAVIVPVGSKGGFVVKRPPADPTDREAVLAEGIACYRLFISGLLDVTDNLITIEGTTEVLPPQRVVRHDGDDSYLVVAADKGTATFSDIANQLAIDYGYWLGDAFASGGSVGYDHKAMGITARGAWESVKRHFRELGINTQTEDFTVVGIGDMSGDVFGNGMLLSPHIRLVAAFDHRHVFLDPDPDAATSFVERQRLFALPRSSWADYDKTLVSEGGGVYPRSAKSIRLSPEIRVSLGIDEGVGALSPPELLRAILAAPVDLLWNGGIGTYVKATSETHPDVGDKANDAIRVDGDQVRARVVGEGGNLGLTQLGRIDYSLRGADGIGGHINTDAIDNSAGVDTSDHEVNIKIMLDQAVRDGALDPAQRNDVLADMTDEVARLVLVDNYEQNILLGNGRVQAAAMLSVHERLIKSLEARGDLDRELEFLPSRDEIRDRAANGLGLVSSELAVLAAYSKITLTATLLESELPEGAWYTEALRRYFPQRIVEEFGDRLAEHPLRREIVTTWVVNEVVNRGGTTFVFRAQEETGANPVEIVRAFSVIREIFRFDDFWAAVEALDNKVPTDVQSMLFLEGRRLIDRSSRWLVQTRRATIDVRAEVEHFRGEVDRLRQLSSTMLVGSELERLRLRTEEFVGLGVPEELAMQAAALLDTFSFLDIVEIAAAEKLPSEEVAAVYFTVSERIEVDRLLMRITMLPRGDRWNALARSALRYDLYAALAGLASDVLRTTSSEDSPTDRITAWEDRNREGVARAQATLQEVAMSDTFDLAMLSVVLRTIRTLLSG